MATRGRPSTKTTKTETVNKENTQEATVKLNNTESETIKETTVIKEKPDSKRVYSEKKTIPLDYDIPVKSGVQGGLVYVSRKNGYEVHWATYGDVEYLEYSELVAMKNGHKRFFEDNWVFFEDTDEFSAEDIYRALGVDKFYKFIINLENLDDVFNYSVADIEKLVPKMSTGLKQTIACRAKQLINEENPLLDSNKKIKAFENALNCSFTDYE